MVRAELIIAGVLVGLLATSGCDSGSRSVPAASADVRASTYDEADATLRSDGALAGTTLGLRVGNVGGVRHRAIVRFGTDAVSGPILRARLHLHVAARTSGNLYLVAQRLTRGFTESSVYWSCASSRVVLNGVRTCSFTNPLTGVTTSTAWNLDGVAGTTAPFAASTSSVVATRNIPVGDFVVFDVTEDVRAARAEGRPLAWIIAATDETTAETIDFAARECGARCTTLEPFLELDVVGDAGVF